MEMSAADAAALESLLQEAKLRSASPSLLAIWIPVEKAQRMVRQAMRTASGTTHPSP